MKKIFTALFAFFETRSGLLVLGFFVTTLGGTFLNNKIQQKILENEHTFKMYTIRLSEAKELQRSLLETSASRFFYLHKVLAQLAHPENYPRDEVKSYWKANVEPATDKWNKELYYLHAQTRVLFSNELSNMLRTHKEEKPVIHDPVLSKIEERVYEQTIPTTLNGSLMDAHATVYFLLWKCGVAETCDQEKIAALNNLAIKQMDHLSKAQSCFAYRISAELLQYPYGPKATSAIQMPNECERFAPKS